MSRPPGQEILVYVPDWLARNLYSEAVDSLRTAIPDSTHPITISDFITSILVWRALEKDPKFMEPLKQGEEDIKAGRYRRWEDIQPPESP